MTGNLRPVMAASYIATFSDASIGFANSFFQGVITGYLHPSDYERYGKL